MYKTYLKQKVRKVLVFNACRKETHCQYDYLFTEQYRTTLMQYSLFSFSYASLNTKHILGHDLPCFKMSLIC